MACIEPMGILLWDGSMSGRFSFRRPYYELIYIISVAAKEFIVLSVVFERITLVDELPFRPRRTGTTQRECTSTSTFNFT